LIGLRQPEPRPGEGRASGEKVAAPQGLTPSSRLDSALRHSCPPSGSAVFTPGPEIYDGQTAAPGLYMYHIL